MSDVPLHVVCYTLYITLRPRVFENRVLMGMFGPKRDEFTGESKKLHHETLNP